MMTRRAFFAVLFAGPSAWARMLKPRPNYKTLALYRRHQLTALRPRALKESR